MEKKTRETEMGAEMEVGDGAGGEERGKDGSGAKTKMGGVGGEDGDGRRGRAEIEAGAKARAEAKKGGENGR